MIIAGYLKQKNVTIVSPTPNFNMFQRKKSFGFSIIELLVVIAIIGIISTLGLVSYINFSRNQLVITTARKVVQEIRYAQSMALNNQQPELCESLKSYSFMFVSDIDYEIIADCVVPITVKTGSLAQNVSKSGFTQVKFKILRQGIEFTGGQALSLTANNKTRSITIGTGGDINIDD